MRKIFLFIFVLDILLIAVLFFSSITLSGTFCQPWLDKLTHKNNLIIRFDSVSFNLRKSHFKNLSLAIGDFELFRSETLHTHYKYSQIFSGNWANFWIQANQLTLSPPPKALMDIDTINVDQLTFKIKGGLGLSRSSFTGEGEIDLVNTDAQSDTLFVKKLGQFLRLTSFEILHVEKITLKFKHDGVKLTFPEVTGSSDDFTIQGHASYDLGKDLNSSFKLVYESYIPGKDIKEGSKKLSFSVYGPLKKPEYRITG